MSKKANITGNAISEFGYNYPNEWDNAASGILAYSDNKDCEMIISGNLITIFLWIFANS